MSGASSDPRTQVSGRKARRLAARSQKLRGAGWTRSWRKGRTKRQRPQEVQDDQVD